mmetsp:Transcript_13010/g.50860  ORF Transcript_13010/g.50860 Transcript_13010/m.50860 type:complete len:264 (+) Transcript_13010:983-1774(+)
MSKADDINTNRSVLEGAYVELGVAPLLRLLPRRQQRRVDRGARVDETPLHEPIRRPRRQQEELLDARAPRSTLQVLQQLIAPALVAVPRPHRERRHLRDRPRLPGTRSRRFCGRFVHRFVHPFVRRPFVVRFVPLVPTKRRARDDLSVAFHHREVTLAHLRDERLVRHSHGGTLSGEGLEDGLDVDPIPGLGGAGALVPIPAHHRADAVICVQLQEERARDGVVDEVRATNASLAAEHRGAHLLRASLDPPLQSPLREPLPRG